MGEYFRRLYRQTHFLVNRFVCVQGSLVKPLRGVDLRRLEAIYSALSPLQFRLGNFAIFLENTSA